MHVAFTMAPKWRKIETPTLMTDKNGKVIYRVEWELEEESEIEKRAQRIAWAAAWRENMRVRARERAAMAAEDIRR